MNLYLKMMRLFIFFAVLFCIGCQENNFSDAMMEQFWILDKTIAKSNKEIIYGIESVIAGMEQTAMIRTQYLPLLHKTKEIQNLTLNFNAYIDTLREQLGKGSGGFYTKEEAEKQGRAELEGRPVDGRNTNIPSAIFKIAGDTIQKKILNLREELLQLVESLWDNGGVKGTIFAELGKQTTAIEELQTDLTINGLDSYLPKAHQNKTWVEFTFSNKPVAAICPILRKLQNDAILLESISINFLASQQTMMTLGNCLDEPFIVALSPKPKIQLGEVYEARLAFVEHFSSATFTITVNNQGLKMMDRTATYQTKPTTIGKKKYTAKVALKNPLTGETTNLAQDFYYEVVP